MLLAASGAATWVQVCIEGGILAAILGALVAAGRLFATVDELKSDVKEIKDDNKAALKGFEERIKPLERDYWARRGDMGVGS